MSGGGAVAIAAVVVALVLALGSILTSVTEVLSSRWKCSFLSESAVLILLGVVIGGISTIGGDAIGDTLQFNDSIFLFALLPPIIFDSALGIRKRAILQNFGSILLLAVFGTLFTSFIGSLILYGIASTNMEGLGSFRFMEVLLLSAILSAVDPVSVFALLNRILPDDPSQKQSPLLVSLIFGESVFNDAVAIVLYQSVSSIISRKGIGVPPGQAIGEGIEFFFINVFVASSFGILSGIVLALGTKYITPLRHSTAAVVVFIYALALSGYAAAESLGYSGIISVFTAGMMATHYASWNVEAEQWKATREFVHMVAYISETLIFIYLGIAPFVHAAEMKWAVGFLFITVIVLTGLRFIQTFVLGCIANLGRKRKIIPSELVFVSLSGLRGAISFSLAFASLDKKSLVDKNVMFTTTIGVVYITTFLMGGTAEKVLHCLGLIKKTSAAASSHHNLSASQSSLGEQLLSPYDMFDHNPSQSFRFNSTNIVSEDELSLTSPQSSEWLIRKDTELKIAIGEIDPDEKSSSKSCFWRCFRSIDKGLKAILRTEEIRKDRIIARHARKRATVLQRLEVQQIHELKKEQIENEKRKSRMLPEMMQLPPEEAEQDEENEYTPPPRRNLSEPFSDEDE